MERLVELNETGQVFCRRGGCERLTVRVWVRHRCTPGRCGQCRKVLARRYAMTCRRNDENPLIAASAASALQSVPPLQEKTTVHAH